MDVSAQATMKGAAKCDKHCELQNSVNQQIFERILRCQDIPDSMPASVSVYISYPSLCLGCFSDISKHALCSVLLMSWE